MYIMMTIVNSIRADLWTTRVWTSLGHLHTLLLLLSRSVVSDSVRPHRRQPTRLPRPQDSPGKNTGVGCHFLLQGMEVKSESGVAQSCPTLSGPMGCSPPSSSGRSTMPQHSLVCDCLNPQVKSLGCGRPAAKADFWLCRIGVGRLRWGSGESVPLTPALFKGQLYTVHLKFARSKSQLLTPKKVAIWGDGCVNLSVVVISQCTCISNHHTVFLRYIII